MELLNQREVLKTLDISWKRLRQLEVEGKINPIRISLGTVRYFKKDIEALKGTLQQGGE